MTHVNTPVAFATQTQVRDFLFANTFLQLKCEWFYGEHQASCTLYAGDCEGHPCIMYKGEDGIEQVAGNVLDQLFDGHNNPSKEFVGTLRQFLQPKG